MKPIKYYVLYFIFCVAIFIMKKAIELCMWFDIDMIECADIGPYRIDDETIDAMAALHSSFDKQGK
jgi:hypothetical protein